MVGAMPPGPPQTRFRALGATVAVLAIALGVASCSDGGEEPAEADPDASLDEASGEAAVRADPDDPAAIAAAIVCAWTSSPIKCSATCSTRLTVPPKMVWTPLFLRENSGVA